MVISALSTVTKRSNAGTEGLRNKRTSGDHLNHKIIKIGYNTEKSPGDLRKLTDEKPSAKSAEKKSQF